MLRPHIALVHPIAALEADYLDLARECATDAALAQSGFGFPDPGGSSTFAMFVAHQLGMEREQSLAPGRVPQLNFWAVDSARLVGLCSLRTRLTPALEARGGHIGYMVRMSERGRGYGKAILALALDEARAIGLTKVLITCNSTNAGSRGVIAANGGELAVGGAECTGGTEVLRYWITL